MNVRCSENCTVCFHLSVCWVHGAGVTAFLSVCQMSTISEEEWKIALTEILEELDGSQYKKMMLFLSDIPKHVRTDKPREEMPQVIIEHYGVETSVLEIKNIMDRIPRRDTSSGPTAPLCGKTEEETGE